MRPLSLVLILCSWMAVLPVRAEALHIAVAANFTAPFRLIADAFEQDTGHQVLGSFGSTGQLYAQIRNGAPFALLLSADSATAQRLDEEGETLPGSRFTYAIGALVLWSPRADYVDDQGRILETERFRRLAVGNPKTAPYGRAAAEVIGQLGLSERLRSRRVEGQSISQTLQFVSTGNAELGFVALSQVYRDGALTGGSAWRVPQHLYTPLRQDAVILKRAGVDPLARSFAEYLRGERAAAIIESFGYALPQD